MRMATAPLCAFERVQKRNRETDPRSPRQNLAYLEFNHAPQATVKARWGALRQLPRAAVPQPHVNFTQLKSKEMIARRK
jgi:hypothetical protein